MKGIIAFFKYLYFTFTLKVIEPNIVLPRSYTVALYDLKGSADKNSSYKIYPLEDTALSIKVQINKIVISEENVKYLFSSWFKGEEFLKYGEEEYETLIKIVREKTKGYKGLHIKRDISYEEIENLLFSGKNDSEIEYILDYIYKNYTERLFDLKESIFSSQNSLYIKSYYTKLLVLLFGYTSYDDLVKYYESLEQLYVDNINVKFIEEKLLQMIQDKNLLDIQMDKILHHK